MNNGNGMIHKNWLFFEYKNKIVYLCWVSPFLLVDGIEQIIINYASNEFFRGGSCPVFIEEENTYYIFVHKMCDYQIYVIAFINIEDMWRIKGYSNLPISNIDDGKVQFVSGAVFNREKREWILSGGLGDSKIAFWTVGHEDILNTLIIPKIHKYLTPNDLDI